MRTGEQVAQEGHAEEGHGCWTGGRRAGVSMQESRDGRLARWFSGGVVFWPSPSLGRGFLIGWRGIVLPRRLAGTVLRVLIRRPNSGVP